MSIPLSSTMSKFSFTKVENWKNVNSLPKCTRLHQIASQISKCSRGWHPQTPVPVEGTPLLRPLPARRFAPRLLAFGHSIVFLTVPHSPWNKRLHKALRSYYTAYSEHTWEKTHDHKDRVRFLRRFNSSTFWWQNRRVTFCNTTTDAMQL